MSKTVRQTMRFYSMWSHHNAQRVYYHTNGVEHTATVINGAFYGGQPGSTYRHIAALIGSDVIGSLNTLVNRKHIAEAAKTVRNTK